MGATKNVFIAHVHEDDDLLPKLKALITKAGMEVRDGSINSDKPNEAESHEYIKSGILAPRIQWASTLLVLITHDTADSWWVNWEIDYAVKQGKNVVGVFCAGSDRCRHSGSASPLWRCRRRRLAGRASRGCAQRQGARMG